ncbi:hypothetical protein [Treponema sp.]|uniref:hypothetical protein n=1 Tax=Treponema sp. TaxID=166 RepID=UPI0025D8DF69|nr:hypothetical protein [Treponema sp.]MCR5219219.1 hypothetical protein [Treponema sp.]
MKRKIAVAALSMLFFCQQVFAVSDVDIENKEIAVLDVRLAELVETVRSLEAGKNYEIVLSPDFLPSEVTPSMIQSLHEFFTNHPDSSLAGPIEYIYFSGSQSPDSFYKIKKRINAAKDKYVCVDIGNSFYAVNSSTYEALPLPDNCFAGHKNLYWVYFGHFVREDVPENVCKDCTNLSIVFMWGEGSFEKGAFENVAKDALLAGVYGESRSLADYIKARGYQKSVRWDYAAFDENYDYLKAEQGLYTGQSYYNSDYYAASGYSSGSGDITEEESSYPYHGDEFETSLNSILNFYGDK